jgi:hypothetical protein
MRSRAVSSGSYGGRPIPQTFLDLAQQGEIDYKEIGGAINPTSADTPNDIWFTTIGFDMGSSYSIKITMRKKGRAVPGSYTAPVPA